MVIICATSNWLYTIVKYAIIKPRGSQCEYMYIMRNTHLKPGLQATDQKKKKKKKKRGTYMDNIEKLYIYKETIKGN
jgi:hypothetical protein